MTQQLSRRLAAFPILLSLFVFAACDDDPGGGESVTVMATVLAPGVPASITATGLRDVREGVLAFDLRVEWVAESPGLLETAGLAHLVEGDSGGQVAVLRPGCELTRGAAAQPAGLECPDTADPVQLAFGEVHEIPLELHLGVDGASPVSTHYIVDEPIRWTLLAEDTAGRFDAEGAFTVRITVIVD